LIRIIRLSTFTMLFMFNVLSERLFKILFFNFLTDYSCLSWFTSFLIFFLFWVKMLWFFWKRRNCVLRKKFWCSSVRNYSMWLFMLSTYSLARSAVNHRGCCNYRGWVLYFIPRHHHWRRCSIKFISFYYVPNSVQFLFDFL